jgi:hypothetical protein
METLKVRPTERFGENVRRVVRGSDTKDSQFVEVNELSGRIIFDSEVSHFGVPPLVFGELSSRVIGTLKPGRLRGWHVDVVKHLP